MRSLREIDEELGLLQCEANVRLGYIPDMDIDQAWDIFGRHPWTLVFKGMLEDLPAGRPQRRFSDWYVQVLTVEYELQREYQATLAAYRSIPDESAPIPVEVSP